MHAMYLAMDLVETEEGRWAWAHFIENTPSQGQVNRVTKFAKTSWHGLDGITETIITCKTGIRYTGIGHNGIRYIKTGIRYNAIRDNGIRYNGEQESVITLKWAIWNQV